MGLTKMASLGAIRAVTKRALFDKSIRPYQLIAIRQGSDGGPQPWNYLWRPDIDIPVTKEAKAAAARKYGMIEEDYEPLGLEDGDLGEPMPIKFHVYTATQLDAGRKWPRPNFQWGLGFLTMIIVTFTLFSHSPRSYFPRMGRPMCWDGPHYSFEPEDGGRDITAEQPAHH